MPEPEIAVRATIFADADARAPRRPLYLEVLRRARDFGLDGATVLAGVEGFGSADVLHTDRLLDLSDGLPVVIVLVDSEPRVLRFMGELADLLDGVLVTFKEVTVLGGGAEETSVRGEQ